jgi:hypothetical protein
VYDVVTDLDLNRLAVAFFEAEALGQEPGYAKVVERLLAESGLAAEGVDTLLALRKAVRDHQEQDKKRKGAKAKVGGIRGG